MFNHLYPYGDMHEFNLDSLLLQVKELSETVENWIITSEVKFADPINWNPSTFYPRYTIVLDSATGDSYLAKKDTPSGLPLSNTEYWYKIANFNAQYTDLDNRVRQNTENIADNYEELERQINAIKTNYLYNKRVVVFGDSIVASNRPNNYIYKLANKYNMSVTNLAVAGYPLVHREDDEGNDGEDIIMRQSEIDADIVFICYGTNDWNLNAQINHSYSSSDRTFKETLERCIKHIEAVNPIARIICVTPCYCERDFVLLDNHQGNYNLRGAQPEDYANAMIEVCNKLGVLVVDMYHSSGCNHDNIAYLMDSGDIKVHPNEYLYRIMADIIANASQSPIYKSPSFNNNYLSDSEFGGTVTNAEWADIALKNIPSGVFAKVAPRASMVGKSTHTLYPNVKYVLRGYANNACYVTVDNKRYCVVYEFEIYFTPSARSIGAITIENASGNDLVIGGLYLSDVKNEYDGYASFNVKTQCNVVHNLVTTTVPLYNKIRDNKLELSGGLFGTTGTIPAQTKLIEMPNTNFEGLKFFYVCDASHNTTMMFYFNGNGIYNYNQLSANQSILINPMTISLEDWVQN